MGVVLVGRFLRQYGVVERLREVAPVETADLAVAVVLEVLTEIMAAREERVVLQVAVVAAAV